MYIMHTPWSYVPLSSFVFADSTRCQFAVVLHDGFPMFVTQVFHCDYRLNAEVLLVSSLFVLLYNGLNIAENEA